ncbi:hypothetical protein GCM10010145_65460 [Streptomyces ruber]|uniref:Uncharacterized protein n=2 Tax=Streptomyces TaxID=1883 RepID=A0A918F010_9ACTN|nr:hypothetical protein GCM10010145_65460 [Streptomyces ruber]
MPVEFLLDHFLQCVQQPGVGPFGRAAEVGRGDRHSGLQGDGDNVHMHGHARVARTYGIVGYETVGYETVG